MSQQQLRQQRLIYISYYCLLLLLQIIPSITSNNDMLYENDENEDIFEINFEELNSITGPDNNTNTTTCPSCPCLLPSECIPLNLECQNHGGFPLTSCYNTIDCSNDNNNELFWISPACQCIDGYSGFECRVISDESYCTNQGLILDNTFYNDHLETIKYYDCIIPYTSTTESFELKQHRAEATFNAQDGTLRLTVLSRAKDSNLCTPTETFLDCECGNCYREALPSSEYPFKYAMKCPEKSCSASSNAPDLLQLAVWALNSMSDPFTLKFTDTNDNGKGNVKIGSFGGFSIDFQLECYTGTCATQLGSDPLPLKSDEEPSAAIAISLVSIFVICCIIVVIASICVNIRDKAASMFSQQQEEEEASTSATTTIQMVVPTSTISTSCEDNLIDETYKIQLPDNTMLSSTPVSTPVLLYNDITYDIPGTSHCLSLDNRYVVMNSILENIHGLIKSGEILGLLGPSGSGKTTLLDILSGINKVGDMTGHIQLLTLNNNRNGNDVNHISSTLLQENVSYVYQDDSFMSNQTVIETLFFSARLRLSKNITDTEIHYRVKNMLFELKLDSICNNMIGDVKNGISGISGGERKRLAIGCELIYNPPILICDEPTSGLDSKNAELVMSTLKQAAKLRKCAVLISIHQPTHAIFNNFDNIMLLTRCGQQAWYGKPQDAMEYFKSIGRMPSSLQEEMIINPAEFLMDQATDPDTTSRNTMIKSFIDSDAELNLRKQMLNATKTTNNIEVIEQQQQQQQQQISIINILLLLTARLFRQVARAPRLLFMHLILNIIIALGIGFTFYQIDNTIPGMQNRAGVFLFSLSNINIFVDDRIIFQRERTANYYKTLPYLFSQLMADIIPLRILPTIIFGSIVYYLVGLYPNIYSYMVFISIFILINLCATGVCFACSSMFATTGQATLAAVLIFIFSMLFGGLFLSNASDNSLFVWLRYLSFFYYAFSSLMLNEFRNVEILFNPQGFGSVWISGDIVLENFAVPTGVLDTYMYVLSSFFIGFILIAFLSLSYLHKARK